MMKPTPYDWLAYGTAVAADAWARVFAGWTQHLYDMDGKPAAALFQKGTEVHFVLAPEARGRALRKDVLRESLTKLLAEDGMLTTRSLLGSACRRFIERMGFKHTWSDETFDYFALTRAPFFGDRT